MRYHIKECIVAHMETTNGGKNSVTSKAIMIGGEEKAVESGAEGGLPESMELGELIEKQDD